MEWQAQVNSFQKPLPYTEEKDIKTYLLDFELFMEIIGLTKKTAFKIFLSYLPDKCRNRLRSLQLSNDEMEDW